MRPATGRGRALAGGVAWSLTLLACSHSAGSGGGPPADQLRAGLIEWNITTSAGLLAPHAVITVTNAGTTIHDLRVQGAHVDSRTPRLAPGGTATLDLDLRGERNVRLTCTVSGHAAQGMSRRLTVSPKG